jgi:hypothetical protein
MQLIVLLTSGPYTTAYNVSFIHDHVTEPSLSVNLVIFLYRVGLG